MIGYAHVHFMLNYVNKMLLCDIYIYAHVHRFTKYVIMHTHIICHITLLIYLTVIKVFNVFEHVNCRSAIEKKIGKKIEDSHICIKIKR
ncbi:hypothetical protein HanXRQr2_Chr14g0622971 [Helianthus annuus]|uniref:Uncharacterized protein n=1 Tax=Helianthus annuus TaxID=4232 RepID=A0A251SEQ0_HELAN|nr:hypothetical protein HanXRQr2_Chr14g0622971 [Helianthus annuus]